MHVTRFLMAILATAVPAAAQTCGNVAFKSAHFANLIPSNSSTVSLLRQKDGTYTAVESVNASPYLPIRSTPNFQKHVAACSEFLSTNETLTGPLSITALKEGGYLTVTAFPQTNPTGFTATLFDANHSLISQSNYSGSLTLTVGDVNGDGIPDIVSINNSSGLPSLPSNQSVAVYLGNGGSSFQPPVSYLIGSDLSIEALVLADANGDGKMDVLVASSTDSELAGTIQVLYGNGDGTLQSAVTLVSEMVADALAIADVNQDGKPDLLFSSSGYSVAQFGQPALLVALGKGGGTFGAPSITPTASTGPIAVGDLNGDGFVDVAVAGFSILFGDGKGNFPTRKDYDQDTSGPLSITDFDGDGNADVVVGIGSPAVYTGSGISVLFGAGGGVFSGSPLTVTPSLDMNGVPSTADFNNDGIPDLAVMSDNQVAILLGARDGTFATSIIYTAPAGSAPLLTAPADFNGDGKPDLAVLIQGYASNLPLNPQIVILLGQGNGAFSAPIVMGANFNNSPTGAVTGDFNGDGKMDLAVLTTFASSTVQDQVQVYLGDGKGGFSPPMSSLVGGFATQLRTADFNGDGKLDFAVVTSKGVSILLGTGDGTFATSSIPLGGSSDQTGSALAIGDFNSDGHPDLAVVCCSGPLRILLGNGDGSFHAAGSYPAVFNSGLAVGDLNGDGFPDLVLAGLYEEQYPLTECILGNGNGTFQLPAGGCARGGYPLALSIAGGGKSDIVSVSGTAAVTLINQSAVPSALTIVSAANPAGTSIAPASLASAYGSKLTGGTVSVTDATGNTSPATVIYSGPSHINFVVPDGLSQGEATVTISVGSVKQTAPVQIANVSPGLFVLNNAVQLAAAYAIRFSSGGTQTFEPDFVSQSGSNIPSPISLGASADQTYLVLFGTGLRHASSVSANVEGIAAQVTYLGPGGGIAGLDQVNILLPPRLAGAGDVNVALSAGGSLANNVHLTVQ